MGCFMLGRKLRRKFIFARFYRGPGLSRKKAAKIIIPLLLIIAGCATIVIKVTPMVTEIAIADATDIIRDTANDAIVEIMSTGDYDYSQLVTLEKGANGEVTALVTNMKKINVLQTEVASRVLDNVERMEEDIVIKIPLGNLTDIAVLSGRGPTINVRLLTITSVDTSFSNVFTAAGINQTRHQILMNVDVEVGIILPTGTTTETVTIEVVVAETVIVGSVPETYTDFK